MTATTETRAADKLLLALRRATQHDERYTILEQFRSLGPVVKVRTGAVVVGHDIAAEVLGNATRFVLPTPSYFDATQRGWRDHLAATLCAELVLIKEGDGHRATRAAMHRAFTAAVGGKFVVRLERHIDMAVERLAALINRDGGADAATELAQPITAAVFADITDLSIPEVLDLIPHSFTLARVIDDALRTLSDIEDQAAHQLQEIVGRVPRRQSPLRELAPADILSLLQPGVVNLSTAINNLVWVLDQHPHERVPLLAGPVLPDAAVDEVMRHCAPVHGAIRITRTDLELADVPVRAGEAILVFTAAANRDPVHWLEPDAFQPGRTRPSRMLTFGHGPHACMGQALIRMVLARVPARLYSRIPTLRVATPPTVRPGLLRYHLDMHLEAP